MNNDFNMGFPSDTVSRTCHFKHDTFLIRNPWYYFPLYPVQKPVQKFFFNPSAKVGICCFLFFNSLLFNPQAVSENENVFFQKHFRKNETNTARELLMKNENRNQHSKNTYHEKNKQDLPYFLFSTKRTVNWCSKALCLWEAIFWTVLDFFHLNLTQPSKHLFTEWETRINNSFPPLQYLTRNNIQYSKYGIH